MGPKVSAIITTRNSAKTLERLIKSLKNQTYKNLEIIVVDNNSSDKTVEIAKRYTKKVYQKGPERSAQRNLGAEKSTGKFLLFLDSDMILEKAAVAECIREIKSGKGIGGVVIPEVSFGRGMWAKAKALERKINEGEVFFEAARFFPRKVFKEMGGYDLSITGPEDWEFTQRVGDNFKRARVRSYLRHDEGNLRLSTLMRKKYYYGLTAHRYLRKRKLPVFGPSTVYFLRPAFYRRWRLLLKNPFLSLAMVFMLSVELFSGGIGFLKGKLRW